MDQESRIAQDTDLARWSEAIAACFDPDASAEIPTRLAVALKALVPHDFTTCVVLNRNTAPLVIHDEFTDEVEPIAFERSPYVFDPPYQHLLAGTLPITCRLRELMPDGFEQSDFYRYYYDHVASFDDFLYNIPVGRGSIVQVALTRIGSDCDFDEHECAILVAVEPLVSQSVGCYIATQSQDIASHDNRADALHDRLSAVVDNFGSSVLTQRERQVVGMLLKGFSDALAAERLVISTSTLRNHKKSIYRKLGVTSQGQVFSILLDALALDPEDIADWDPVPAVLAARRKKIARTG